MPYLGTASPNVDTTGGAGSVDWGAVKRQQQRNTEFDQQQEDRAAEKEIQGKLATATEEEMPAYLQQYAALSPAKAQGFYNVMQEMDDGMKQKVRYNMDQVARLHHVVTNSDDPEGTYGRLVGQLPEVVREQFSLTEEYNPSVLQGAYGMALSYDDIAKRESMKAKDAAQEKLYGRKTALEEKKSELRSGEAAKEHEYSMAEIEARGKNKPGAKAPKNRVTEAQLTRDLKEATGMEGDIDPQAKTKLAAWLENRRANMSVEEWNKSYRTLLNEGVGLLQEGGVEALVIEEVAPATKTVNFGDLK